MKLIREGYALPIHPALIEIIETELETIDTGDANIILNFRDPDYSAETGGYHPVEILLINGRIQYITDFAYVGSPPCVELAKELDFDFSLNLFQQGSRDHPIDVGQELFKIWSKNFCHYFRSDVFNVSVESY